MPVKRIELFINWDDIRNIRRFLKITKQYKNTIQLLTGISQKAINQFCNTLKVKLQELRPKTDKGIIGNPMLEDLESIKFNFENIIEEIDKKIIELKK